jgi:hypothetical protein
MRALQLVFEEGEDGGSVPQAGEGVSSGLLEELVLSIDDSPSDGEPGLQRGFSR